MLIPFAFLFGACTQLDTVSSKTQSQIVALSDVTTNDYVLTNLYPGQGITIGFDDSGRVFGYSGLNRYFGKATIENGQIKIEELASTRMGGPQEALVREAQYLAMLKDMTDIAVKENKLILSNDAGEVLKFEVKK